MHLKTLSHYTTAGFYIQITLFALTLTVCITQVEDLDQQLTLLVFYILSKKLVLLDIVVTPIINYAHYDGIVGNDF